MAKREGVQNSVSPKLQSRDDAARGRPNCDWRDELRRERMVPPLIHRFHESIGIPTF